MSVDQLKEKTFSGLFFKTIERISLQGVSLLISIVLARILLPEDYGNVSIILVVVTILDVVVNYGLGSSLIQKKNPDALDFNTCFIASFIFSAVLAFALFASAPYISIFFGKNELTVLIRVLCVRVVFSGIQSIQNAYVAKLFLFKKTIVSTFVSSVLSGCIGIILAKKGYGEWALVWQALLSSIISVFVLGLLLKIPFSFQFSFDRLKKLLRFGSHLLINGLLNSLYDELRSILIAKKYSTTDLAYYDKGRNFPKMISNNVNAIIDGVLLSTMSSVQDDRDSLVRVLSKSISISMYILSPMLVGLFMISDDLILFLYTDKWISASLYMKIFCISFFTMPVITLQYNAIKSIGRSGIVLLIDSIVKSIGIVVLFIVLRHGVKSIAISLIGLNYLTTLLVMITSKKLFAYRLWHQVKDIFIDTIPAFVMGCVICLGNRLTIPIGYRLVFNIAIGFSVFLCVSVITNNKTLKYLISLLRKGK